MKFCNKCKINKSLDDFGNNKKSEDSKQRYCKQCHAEWDEKNYFKHKEGHRIRRKRNQQNISKWLKEYKKELECSKCKDKRWYLLHFHHLNSKEKEYNVADLQNRSINSLLVEIEKCIPLCANCHTEFHYFEKLNKITIKEYLDVAE